VGADVTATQRDTSLDFQAAGALEASADFAWSGTVTIEEEGDYTFLVQPALDGGSEGGGSVLIDGKRTARTGGPGFGGTGMVAKKWSGIVPTVDGRDNGMGTVHLSAGAHRIDLTANSTGEAPLRIRFSWITPAMRRAATDAAVEAARGARTAVIFAWSGGGVFNLPEGQDDLIARVAAAARKTVVVLNTGGPVAMPWVEKVGAILEMWYPGQEGGWATADLLLGRANPSGRLPVTFPKRVEDTAAYAPGHPERNAPPAAPGMSGMNANAPVVTYSERTLVGYRWLDAMKIAPLFPFGHGLSYTTFEYKGLVVKRTGSTAEVTFAVRNAGRVRGSEVVQVYLGSGRALAAFERVDLEAGASRVVTLRLSQRTLSNWSTEHHGWRPSPGPRMVYVGASSRDIRMEGLLAAQ
jgi:beta-glucosidase